MIVNLGADKGLVFVRWSILYLSFCCLFWCLGESGGCVLRGRKFFWDLDLCGCWEFQVKCGFEYWELTVRNRDGLGDLQGCTGGRKTRMW